LNPFYDFEKIMTRKLPQQFYGVKLISFRFCNLKIKPIVRLSYGSMSCISFIIFWLHSYHWAENSSPIMQCIYRHTERILKKAEVHLMGVLLRLSLTGSFYWSFICIIQVDMWMGTLQTISSSCNGPCYPKFVVSSIMRPP
jgi:hypothetical protein